MKICKKYIRSLKPYLGFIESNQEFVIVASLNEKSTSQARKIGLNNSGERVLPTHIGRITVFNAEGRYDQLKDEPKENRYINTIEWSWEQWSSYGQTVTKTENKDIFKDCYKRKFIEPPAIELAWVNVNEADYVSSPLIDRRLSSDVEIIHTINLFLEIFGECEIRKNDYSSFTPPNLKRVNWNFLPPGNHPWSKVKQHLEKSLGYKSSRYLKPILDRQEFIVNFEPDTIFTGEGGFETYLAYVFDAKKLVVLESIQYGNAIYVFGDDWRTFSQLSKAEILNSELCKDRIIHTSNYQSRFIELFNKPLNS